VIARRLPCRTRLPFAIALPLPRLATRAVQYRTRCSEPRLGVDTAHLAPHPWQSTEAMIFALAIVARH